MLTYNAIIGSASQTGIAEQLHRLEHKGAIEYVVLAGDDIQRHRLRGHTDRGNEYGIALDRSVQLFDGAVLRLDDSGAVVVRTAQTAWLCLRPRDAAAALELGYFAGNMHWAVRFDGTMLCVAVKGAAAEYLKRLQPMLDAGSISVDPAVSGGAVSSGIAADAHG